MNFINFNEHISEKKLNIYGGSEKKRTIILDNGKQYMLKFPDPVRELNREISYINNAISEYLGCRIFKEAGFSVQNVILGEYTDENGKSKVACACEDIRLAGDTLHEAEVIELELLDSKEKLTLNNVKRLLSGLNGVNADDFFKEYCNRFIIDALIGNTDRHDGNWGIIENSGAYRIAPVFDCGSSFSPLYTDNELEDIVVSNEALNTMSIVTDETGKRLHYRDFLMSGCNESINAALREVVPEINVSRIDDIIDEIPYITDIRKNFYKQLIEIRYDKVLIPALENVLGIEKSLEYKQWNSAVIDFVYSKLIKPFEHLPKSGRVSLLLNDEKINSLEYKQNGGHIFFLNGDHLCVGIASTEKTNLNISKFIQSLRKIGFKADIDSIKKEISLNPERIIFSVCEEKPSILEFLNASKGEQKQTPDSKANEHKKNNNIDL